MTLRKVPFVAAAIAALAYASHFGATVALSQIGQPGFHDDHRCLEVSGGPGCESTGCVVLTGVLIPNINFKAYKCDAVPYPACVVDNTTVCWDDHNDVRVCRTCIYFAEVNHCPNDAPVGSSAAYKHGCD